MEDKSKKKTNEIGNIFNLFGNTKRIGDKHTSRVTEKKLFTVAYTPGIVIAIESRQALFRLILRKKKKVGEGKVNSIENTNCNRMNEWIL